MNEKELLKLYATNLKSSLVVTESLTLMAKVGIELGDTLTHTGALDIIDGVVAKAIAGLLIKAKTEEAFKVQKDKLLVELDKIING